MTKTGGGTANRGKNTSSIQSSVDRVIQDFIQGRRRWSAAQSQDQVYNLNHPGSKRTRHLSRGPGPSSRPPVKVKSDRERDKPDWHGNGICCLGANVPTLNTSCSILPPRIPI
uniref:Uncharacterized protein n=1 Tax=Knipowitschia caucasica TaxID=637954 RepID=A0AAV2MKQ4_KNICA